MVLQFSTFEKLVLGISSITLIRIYGKYFWKNRKPKENDKVIINKIVVDLDTNNIPEIENDFESEIKEAIKTGIKNLRIYRSDELISLDNDPTRLNIEYKNHLSSEGKKKMITKIFMG